MELRNLEELKTRVASIVLSSNNPASHSQALALTTGAPSQSGHDQAIADTTQAQQQPSWLHNSDPSSLQLFEQDALIYNKYVTLSIN